VIFKDIIKLLLPQSIAVILQARRSVGNCILSLCYQFSLKAYDHQLSFLNENLSHFKSLYQGNSGQQLCPLIVPVAFSKES
jgi:hypothetical protein